MHVYLILCLAAAMLVLWILSVRCILAILKENISTAMGQIGMRVSSLWEMHSLLLELIKDYENAEYLLLTEKAKGRQLIDRESTVQETAEQATLLLNAMCRFMVAAEHHPPLKADTHYLSAMDSFNRYEGMARQGRLFYNDSVTKFNRQLRSFPASMIAKLLGFEEEEYLEVCAGAALPGMEREVS